MTSVKTFLGFAGVLFFIGILAGIGLAVVNSQRGRKARPGIILAVVGLVGILITTPLNAGLVLIEPNEVGVVFRQTGRGSAALREPLLAGLSWVMPFIDQVIKYDVSQKNLDMVGVPDNYSQQGAEGAYSAVRATSSDGQVVFVDVTIIYRLDSTRINDIHINWQNTYVDGYIVPQSRSEVRNVISTYGADAIYSGGRAELETQIADSLSTKLEREGILLTDVLIRNIEFSQEFTDAIEQKQIADQQAQQAAFRVQQAEQEAEQARVEAQGRADSAVIEAQGDAQSTVIRAEAQAEALDNINQILSQNPDLIQWQYINELGDNVRLIIIPSNSPFLFDIQQLMDQAGVPTDTVTPTATPTTPSDTTDQNK